MSTRGDSVGRYIEYSIVRDDHPRPAAYDPITRTASAVADRVDEAILNHVIGSALNCSDRIRVTDAEVVQYHILNIALVAACIGLQFHKCRL